MLVMVSMVIMIIIMGYWTLPAVLAVVFSLCVWWCPQHLLFYFRRIWKASWSRRRLSWYLQVSVQQTPTNDTFLSNFEPSNVWEQIPTNTALKKYSVIRLARNLDSGTTDEPDITEIKNSIRVSKNYFFWVNLCYDRWGHWSKYRLNGGVG